jgi:hypothetical protein
MLKYQCENRFAETFSYDDWEDDQKELLSIYDRIKPEWDDHGKIGVDEDQILYHICYDCNMEIWDEIFQVVRKIGEKSGVNINWEEVKHVMKFTFMWTKPYGKLMPHTAHNLRAACSMNLPLKGKTEIILYDRKKGKNLMFPGSDMYEYARHEYTNPAFLNVNTLHGLENNINEERIILKVHMLITPIEKMIESTGHKGSPLLQLPYAPWLLSKFKQKLWKNNK